MDPNRKMTKHKLKVSYGINWWRTGGGSLLCIFIYLCTIAKCFYFFFIRVYYRCAVLVNLAMPLNSRINDDGYTGYEKWLVSRKQSSWGNKEDLTSKWDKINHFLSSTETAPEIWRRWRIISENAVWPRERTRAKKWHINWETICFLLLVVPKKTLTYTFSFHLPFQVILLCSWIFSVIFNIPLFLARTYKREDGKNHCVLSWPKKWMSTANCYAWLFLVVAAVGLMITLYSQVVLPLWLKPKSCVPLSYKQQVSQNVFH